MLVLVVGITVFLASRDNRQSADRPKKIKVAASFYPLYFFASEIGGERADVVNITPSGAEPHDYEPTAQDVARMEDSSMLILNGGGLEAWGDRIKQNTDAARTLIVTVGEGLAIRQATEEGKTVSDPHVWLSPVLAHQIADKIAGGFVALDPANAAYYQSRGDALKAKLDDLDAAYRDGLSNCRQKNIVTSHAAFGYLVSTYGLTQVPIAGLSPDAEPSPQQLADVVKFATMNHVTHIFFESLVSPKLSQTIAREIGAQVLVLNPIEGLSAQEQAQEKNYFTEMQTNLVNLQIALQCNTK